MAVLANGELPCPARRWLPVLACSMWLAVRERGDGIRIIVEACRIVEP